MAEQGIPEWLTTDFLRTCLQSDEGTLREVAVTSHRIESALPPGNNYGSNMYRVTINYKVLDDESTDKTLSLIIKAPATSGFNENANIDDIYILEKHFYDKYIPETYKLCRHDIVPKQYTSPNPLSVVMEDLRASGYKMVDRHQMLDLNHCQLYIKASAKLHALSVAVYKTNPASIQSLFDECPKFAGNNIKLMNRCSKLSMLCMAAFLEDKPDYVQFSKVFRKACHSGSLDEILGKIQQHKYSLSALTQLDPWCTNMMFKYNSSGEVEGVKLLDFQGLIFTSPVRELVTFLWTSPQPEVRRKNLNDFYRLYCDSLNANLEELGCPERLSLEELTKEITFMSPWAIAMFCFSDPLSLSDQPFDFNELFFSDISLQKSIKETKLYKLFEGSTFTKHYPLVLNEIAELGFLDYFKERIKKQRSKKRLNLIFQKGIKCLYSLI